MAKDNFDLKKYLKEGKLTKENSDSTYNFGCVMLYFNFPELSHIHTLIDEEDIYIEEGDKTFGLEDEPHTTLLYGLHEEVSDGDVEEVLNNFMYSICDVYNPSLFNNEKYDVLKFDVEGENLHETNEALKQFPFTSDYPEYHPHLTIGYIKKGMGQKYVDKINQLGAENFLLQPLYAVYSHPDGTKTKMNIKTD